MKYTKFNIALALTISLLSIGSCFADEITQDNSLKLASCHSCNSAKIRSSLNACSSCNSLSQEEQNSMKQVYSYPDAVYGINNKVGEQNNGVTLSANGVNEYSKGVPLAEANSSHVTGAAANLNNFDTPFFNDLMNNNSSGPKIRIETPTSQKIMVRTWKPHYFQEVTGGAAPIKSFFPDVPSNYWAQKQINRLADEDVVVGYPDSYFKPNSYVSRAEMASMLLHGMNLSEDMSSNYQFSDVPQNHWAYNIINSAADNQLINGYSDNTFRPDDNISKIEAMSMLSKKINSNMSEKNAEKILSNYTNAQNVPDWAKMDVAKVVEANGLKDIPNKDRIFTNSNATRAEVASMLDNIRISLGYSQEDAPIAKSDVEKSYIAAQETITVPTLKLMFKDIVSARSATVGEQFAATTIDTVVIDGVTFSSGSIVRGKVSEVVRPSKGNNGAIKLSFETIQDGDKKANLPTQIHAAQVNQIQQPNFGVKLAQMPFTLAGGIIGTAGRTIGGAVISLSNATEQTLNGLGMANGELMSGQFKASGRSVQDVGMALVKSPVDLTRTAISGTIGVFQSAGDDVAYLVDMNGKKISTIKPQQEVTISFACQK